MPLVYTALNGSPGEVVELPALGTSPQLAMVEDLAAGPTGPTGPAGPTGPTGPTGPSGGGGGRGSISETFSGGNSVAVTATNTNANMGDRAWNVFVTGTGSSMAKLAAPLGAVGVIRLLSPTSVGGFSSLYLGGQSTGIFQFDDWNTLTWRARVDTTVANRSQLMGVGSAGNNILGSGNSAQFFAALGGGGSNPNWQTRTSQASAGNFPQVTSVPIDGLFHDFEIRRVDANTIQFLIDGVLQTTHSTGNGDGMPTGVLLPMAQSFSNSGQGFIDVDQFDFTPL